jgi:hypothetical protein
LAKIGTGLFERLFSVPLSIEIGYDSGHSRMNGPSFSVDRFLSRPDLSLFLSPSGQILFDRPHFQYPAGRRFLFNVSFLLLFLYFQRFHFTNVRKLELFSLSSRFNRPHKKEEAWYFSSPTISVCRPEPNRVSQFAFLLVASSV